MKMKTVIVKSEFGSKWSDSICKYCELSDSEVLEELIKKIKQYLDWGYIPIGSPQKYDNGWFLIMYDHKT